MSNFVSTAFSKTSTAWNRMTATATISRMMVPLARTPTYCGGRLRIGRAKMTPSTGTMTRRLLPSCGTNKRSSWLLELDAQTASRASSTCVNRKKNQNKHVVKECPDNAQPLVRFQFQQQGRGGEINAVSQDQDIERFAERAEDMM